MIFDRKRMEETLASDVREAPQGMTREEKRLFMLGAVEKLVDLCNEPYYTLPSGLTREERRQWIHNIVIEI